VGKTTLTHFAKQKLEQKQNSPCKKLQSAKICYNHIQNKDKKKKTP
jgi:hypothetical protein